MTSTPDNGEEPSLDRLWDALTDDVVNASDEEFLAEHGDEVDELAAECEVILNRALQAADQTTQRSELLPARRELPSRLLAAGLGARVRAQLKGRPRWAAAAAAIVVVALGVPALLVVFTHAPLTASAALEQARAAAAKGDLVAAFHLTETAAKQGDARAENALGRLYQLGLGAPASAAEAQRWYRMAAGHGSVAAKTNLGMLAATGNGVTQNIADAAGWYRQAAEAGDARAQNNLGVLYTLPVALASTEGSAGRIGANPALAGEWLRKASDHDDIRAEISLGAMLATGALTEIDDKDAVWFYDKARAHELRGEPDAAYLEGSLPRLGEMIAAKKHMLDVKAERDKSVSGDPDTPVDKAELQRLRDAYWRAVGTFGDAAQKARDWFQPRDLGFPFSSDYKPIPLGADWRDPEE